MDDETFAYQLAVWLDPHMLMDVVRRHDTERGRALAPARLAVSSGRLNSGDEANYAELVRKFLRAFRVPPPLVDLMRRCESKPGFSEESWRWLAESRFSGNVRVCSRGNVPPGFPPTTILLVEDVDALVDVVQAPVMALLDLVDQLAVHWRRVAALPASIYHEPNMPTSFYAYVDAQVGAAFLTFIPPPHLTGTKGMKNRYRAVTVYGVAEPADPLWEGAQEAAHVAAASTNEPIPQASHDGS